MAVYRLADLLVRVEGAGKYTSRMLSGYQVEAAPCRRPDIFVSVTRDMVERERQIEGGFFDDNYLECMAVYRAFWEIHPCENVEGGFWKRSCHD